MRSAVVFGIVGMLCCGVTQQLQAECACQGITPSAYAGIGECGCAGIADSCSIDSGCGISGCGNGSCQTGDCVVDHCLQQGCHLGGCATGGCETCGLGGYACCDNEAIDVESLTPEAQSKMLYETSQARIMVELPENADISLLDQKMSLLGTKRSFLVPLLDQKKVYKYDIRVDVVRNGKKYFRKIKREDLRAGLIMALKVEVPDVPEGEHSDIIVALEVVMKGGPPEKTKEPDADATVSLSSFNIR